MRVYIGVLILTVTAATAVAGTVTMSGLGNGQGWNDGSYYTGYRLDLNLRWRVIHRGKVQAEGDGHTIDLSSHGVLFNGASLPTGRKVELSILWPVLLHGAAHMQLLVVGRTIRVNGSQVALRTIQREFRTLATHIAGPGLPSDGTPSIDSGESNLGA
jgi:hypothetical protein